MQVFFQVWIWLQIIIMIFLRFQDFITNSINKYIIIIINKSIRPNTASEVLTWNHLEVLVDLVVPKFDYKH